MDRIYGCCCVLILAYTLKSHGAALGRSAETESNQKRLYESNPFFNLTYPSEQYRYGHYPGHHHHHHDHYHNRKEVINAYNPSIGPNPTNDFDEHVYDNFPNGPKVTSRREVTDESFPGYPYEEIRKFLETNPLLKQYFAEIPAIGNRDGAPSDIDEGETLCKMQTIRTYYPKTLKNINNIERLLVNDDKDYRQALEQTRCASHEQQCSIPFDAFGYTSYCHQNFDNKRLMVYENKTKQIVFDEFKVPSCCVCKIKKN